MTPKTISRISALGLDIATEIAILDIIEDEIAERECPSLGIPADWPADYQAQFWTVYPRKTDKKAAMKSLDKVAFEGRTRWADLINGIERYKLSNDVKKGYAKHPATFLNKGSWMDEEQTGPSPRNGPVSFFEGLDI